MARLAVVIGVSENLPPLKSLSACANDGNAVADVLKQAGRFDDLLLLLRKEDTTSMVAKEKLAAFIERHKGAEVEELFFYFSGHGDFAGNEFYHILSDYDGAARHRTSLSNSELDGMMRGLAPKLFVKIVDACHSGTSYIKRSSEGLEDFLKGTKTGFQNLYFLYSSQSDQVSWTAGELSAFTKCLLLEIGRRDSGVVRYRDLMSAASDYFEASGDQTPHFVTQADFTQVFCESSPAMQAVVDKFVPRLPAVKLPGLEVESGKDRSSLIELIKDADDQYCTREDSINILEKLLGDFSKSVLSEELSSIFSWDVSSSDEKMLEITAIGDWLSKNIDRMFFAEPEYKSVNYKKRVNKNINNLFPSLAMNFGNLFIGGRDEETVLVDAVRQEVSDYRNTCSLPYQKITVHLQPKFKSVLPLECYVLPILSPSHLRLFWAVQQFKRTDWDTTTPVRSVVKWESEEASLRKTTEIADLAQRIKTAFTSSAEKVIFSRWPEAQTKTETPAKKK